MINISNYKENLKGKCIVEISGNSCANCISLIPLLNDYAKDKDVRVVHIEAGFDNMKLIKEFKIRQVPTILICKDAVEKFRVVGFQPQEILELWLDDKLSKI